MPASLDNLSNPSKPSKSSRPSGPSGLLGRLQQIDRQRPSVPGEHLAVFSAGTALLRWAGRTRSPLLRTAMWVAGAAMLYRGVSGRDGLLTRLRGR